MTEMESREVETGEVSNREKARHNQSHEDREGGGGK